MNSIIMKDNENNNKYCINHINDKTYKRLHADTEFARIFLLEQINKGLKPVRPEEEYKHCVRIANKKKRKYLDVVGNQEEFETSFLILIFERRPLFDYTLPINQRSADIVDKLWEEVSNELSAFGTFDKTQLISFWRPLRDSYTRYKNSLKYASSNPSAILPLPKYADILIQLDDVIDKKRPVIGTEGNNSTKVFATNYVSSIKTRNQRRGEIELNKSTTSDPEYLPDQVKNKFKRIKPDIFFVDTNLVSAQDGKQKQSRRISAEYSEHNIQYKKKLKYADVKGNHDEFEICLLNSIFERPPLFDYTLPNVQRSPDVIKKLWEEVSYELSEYGTFDKLQLISFWRRLRDSYTRYDNSLQKARSKPVAILPIPNHVDILKQLDHVIKKKRKMRTSKTETWSDAWIETCTSDSEYFPVEVLNGISALSVKEEIVKLAESDDCAINPTTNSKFKFNSNNKFRKKKKYSNVIGTEEEFEIALLNLIFERPPLFDYKLPVLQRSAEIINKLWAEVLIELSEYGKFDQTQLIYFWRCLRDSYTRYKNSIDKVCHTGSTLTSCVRPKHFDLLKQLDIVIDKRKQNDSISTIIEPSSQKNFELHSLNKPDVSEMSFDNSIKARENLKSKIKCCKNEVLRGNILKQLDNEIDTRRLAVSTEIDATDIYSSDNDFSIPKISKSSITIHSCRTCLNNDGALSLYEQYNNLLIVDMISDLTNVKVNVVEGFFKTICKSCVEKLYAAFVFKQECQNSEKIMQHFVFEDIASKEEPKNISETEFTETYIEFDHNTDDMDLDSKVSLQIELIDMSGEDKLSRNYECDFCFQSFENEQYLAIHKKIIHKEEFVQHHTQIIEEEKIDSISIGILDEKELQLEETMELQCNICFKQFHNNRNLKSHIRRHETPKFICEICSKPFWNKYDLLQHQRLIHLKEKPHKCVICNRGFFFKGALKMHEFIHTGEKPFKCKYCGKTFTHRSSKIIHTKLHTGDKRHQCEICLRRFSFPSHLLVHKREHTGEKPFQCQYCNLGFNRNSALTMHLRIHTGIKPFKCHICEKSFRLREGLKRHVRIHTGEKPFKCMFCDNKYGNAGNLRTHSKHYCKNNPNRIKKVIQNL